MALGNYFFKRKTTSAAVACLDFFGYGLRRLSGISRPLAPGDSYRKVLLIRLDHLGDGIFATPALEKAREVFPRARLTLLAGPWMAPLLKPGLWVDEVKSFPAPWFERPPKRFKWKPFREILRWIRKEKFEVGIDFRGDLRHLLWMALAGIPVRVGYGGTGGGFLLTHEAPLNGIRHEVESNLELLRFFRKDLQAGPLPGVPVSPEAGERVKILLEKEGMGPGKPLVVVQLTAGYPSKEWEPENFKKVLNRLSQGGTQAVIIGSGAEKAKIQAVLQGGSPVLDLSGKTSLEELAALLARARVFIGPDSGPAHLALSLGRPCVLIYSGVNDLRRWGPWARGREEQVRLFHHDVPCSPCGLSTCPIHHECMEPIQEQDVYQAAAFFLKERPLV